MYGPGEKLIAQEGGVHPDVEHQKNFIDCLRNRKRPNADLQQAHLSASLVHFANIAYRAGNRQLIIDPQKELFTDDAEANKLLKVSYRENYVVPEKI